MILIGYLTIFIYVFFLIFIVGNILNKFFNVEISRKVIHTSLFFVWILIDLFLKNTIHQVIVPIIFIIVNYLSYKFKIFKVMERTDDNHPGTVYFSIAITIVLLIAFIFPETYYCSGIATFCLTFGDGMAALVGKNTKSKLIRNNKSLNGFISCFVFSTIATYLFGYFYNLELTILMCISIGMAAAIFELVDRGMDNFSVVGVTFVLSIVFLNYSFSYFLESVILSLILFIIIFFAKGLSYYGSILAMIMCVSYMCFGGLFGITILLSEYFVIFFISKIKKIFIKDYKKDKARTFLQVLINGGLGTLFIILYGIFKQRYLLIVSVISLSGCFIDSISSDVGVLSKSNPYDFIKRRVTQKGISGGVSVLGTVSALICSFIVAFATYKYLNLTYSYLFIITGLIFLQTIVDSILGSLFQAKYRCIKCKMMTEKLEHCNKKTKLIEGFSWVNNNMVNFISSVIVTLLAFLILYKLVVI